MSTFGTLDCWACLGDSLTQEPHSSPTTVDLGWVGQLDKALWPSRGTSNNGYTGQIIGQIQDRYLADVVGKGYYGLVFMGGINDIILNTTPAATIFATFNAIVQDALTRGMKVILMTESPCAGYTGGWPSTMRCGLRFSHSRAASTASSTITPIWATRRGSAPRT